MKPLMLAAALLAAALSAPSHGADTAHAAAKADSNAEAKSDAQSDAKTDTKAVTKGDAKPAVKGSPQVQVVTSLGNFVIELNPERAPLTVAQFLKFVDQGYYSGTIFHRSIPNFVIQGGGYDGDYKLKGSPPKVVNESGNGLTNTRGTVGLARPSEPHDGDVQFYVNLNDNAALDPSAARWGYAVFGKVVQGMDVVDRIGNVATGARGPFKENAPLKNITIEKIERVPASERVPSS
jgi:cyclophilin family peptidyl-prolyl cis-trans isomerase